MKKGETAAGGVGIRALRRSWLALLERRAFAVGVGSASASAGGASVRERDQPVLDLLKFRSIDGVFAAFGESRDQRVDLLNAVADHRVIAEDARHGAGFFLLLGQELLEER